MIRTLWRLSRGYRLHPWQSPYLRWRIETYSGLHAEQITFTQFWSFAWRQRRELLRYLRWAERMSQGGVSRLHIRPEAVIAGSLANLKE